MAWWRRECLRCSGFGFGVGGGPDCRVGWRRFHLRGLGFRIAGTVGCRGSGERGADSVPGLGGLFGPPPGLVDAEPGSSAKPRSLDQATRSIAVITISSHALLAAKPLQGKFRIPVAFACRTSGAAVGSGRSARRCQRYGYGQDTAGVARRSSPPGVAALAGLRIIG